MYLGLNIKGIAIGTIISEYAGVIFGLYYIKSLENISKGKLKRFFKDKDSCHYLKLILTYLLEHFLF